MFANAKFSLFCDTKFFSIKLRRKNFFNVEVAAYLNSRVFRINELILLFWGTFN